MVSKKKPAMKKHINMKLDEQTYERLEQLARSRGIFLSEAVRDCINGQQNELQNDIRFLQQECKDIRQEMKEVRLILCDILPQLMTQRKTQENFDAVGSLIEVVLEKIAKK